MKVLFVFGTRPEAIKMAPLVKAFQNDPAFEGVVCVTSQHKEMLTQVLDFFEIEKDHDLDIMKHDQSLSDIVANALTGLEKVIQAEKPDSVIVQGDTSTAFTGALAGFYQKVHVAHLEAGLRSGDKYAPFPEEINRILVGHTADLHLAPTSGAKENLAVEGIHDNVYVTGNTVIDALYLGLEMLKQRGQSFEHEFEGVDFGKRIVLVTAHRRENHGQPLLDICNAIKQLADTFEDIHFIYPVHLNPRVRGPVFENLSGHDRIHLCDPVDYQRLIWLLDRSYLVLTDSGGIQEEGPALGKPVLVMREVTERPEGVEAGTALLVGSDKDLIVREATTLLTDEAAYTRMSKAVSPYGDGTTSQQVVDIYKTLFKKGNS